jgi:hypothetical protein
LFALLVSGCSSKKELVTVYKYKDVCFKQEIFQKPTIDIYVPKEEEQNLIYFLDANDSAYEKYMDQVDRNNLRCKGIENEN